MARGHQIDTVWRPRKVRHPLPLSVAKFDMMLEIYPRMVSGGHYTHGGRTGEVWFCPNAGKSERVLVRKIRNGYWDGLGRWGRA